MVCKVVCVFHHPLSLLGLLPFIDWLCYIDINIINIAHGKGMERDQHPYIITETLLGCYEFGTHGEDLRDDLGTGPCHFLMFPLCAIGRTQFDKVYP